jgi:hypothetical protein
MLALGLFFVTSAFAAREPLLDAIQLPVIADQLRADGVDDADVRQALVAARETKLSAGDAGEALKVADSEVRKHGPLAAFGDFLARQLHLGKRGKELETAIRAEHRARGTGADPVFTPHKPRVQPRVSAAVVPTLDPKAQKKEERKQKREQRAREREQRRQDREALRAVRGHK